jgi:prophage antirepressor-like protein
MIQIKLFESEEFGNIRTATIDGVPWFVGADVAIALGYINPRDALAKHVDAEDRGVAKCDTLGGHTNLIHHQRERHIQSDYVQ